MTVELFAGLAVSDLPRALAWYERLLGSGPAFRPNDTEAVWELADDRYLYVDLRPGTAGGGMVTLVVDDLEARVRATADRGLEPAARETYENGVRHVTYRDPDGNEFSLGGPPEESG